MFTIKTQSEARQVRAFTHKVADIPGGVTICVAELIPGSILFEGTPVGKGTDDLYHAVKTAKVAVEAAANATSITIEKGSQIKANDFICVGEGGKAVKVASVAYGDTNDTITIVLNDTTGLNKLTKGEVLVEATAASSSTASKFKYAPVALTGASYNVVANDNIFSAAVTIGQVKESNIPPVNAAIKSALKGVVFI